MENCTNNRNLRGNATVYTIAALLVVGFIGTALIKMAQHDVVGGSDYYQATKARVAAKAGLQQFDNLVEKLPDSIITVLYQMAVDSVPSKWVIGSNSAYENLNSGSSYRVEAIGIDPENFVLHVRADGRSGSSKASVHAYYELGNLEFKRVASVDQDFALYIGDVNFNLYGPIDIQGNTRISGNIDFDLWANNSRFRGVFRTSEETNYSYFQGTYIFDTIAYFGTGVSLNGNSHLIFNNLAGFESRPKSSSGSDKIDSYNDVYLNGPATGGADFVWDMHGNKVVKKDPNENGITFQNTLREVFSGSSMDVATTMKLSRNICMPDLDSTSIPAGAILSWSVLKNGIDDPSGSGPIDYYPTYAWDGMDGKMANKIWEYAESNNKLWRGFAVVKVDYKMVPTTALGDEKFKYKMILIVQNGKSVQTENVLSPGLSGKMFQTDTSANTNLVLWAKPGGALRNIGDWTAARGYIYADSGSIIQMGGNGSTFDRFIGAIHVQDNASMAWYPTISGVPTITYDAGVLEDLKYDGFLTFPCAAGADTTNDSIVFVDGFGIDPRILGINY